MSLQPFLLHYKPELSSLQSRGSWPLQSGSLALDFGFRRSDPEEELLGRKAKPRKSSLPTFTTILVKVFWNDGCRPYKRHKFIVWLRRLGCTAHNMKYMYVWMKNMCTKMCQAVVRCPNFPTSTIKHISPYTQPKLA